MTDTYKDAIKSIERERRESEAFLVKGQSARLPREKRAFRQNNVNKECLNLLLHTELKNRSYAKRLQYCEVLFVCKDLCVCLSSSDGLDVQAKFQGLYLPYVLRPNLLMSNESSGKDLQSGIGHFMSGFSFMV